MGVEVKVEFPEIMEGEYERGQLWYHPSTEEVYILSSFWVEESKKRFYVADSLSGGLPWNISTKGYEECAKDLKRLPKGTVVKLEVK